MNMTCHEVRDLLVDYLMAGLSLQNRDGLERHVAACPDCALLLATSRQMLRLNYPFAVGHIEDPRPEDVPESLLRDIIAHGTRWR